MHSRVEMALRAAHRLAWQQQHEYVTVEHLLLTWCRQGYWECAASKCALEQELWAYVEEHNSRALEFAGCSATLGLKRVILRSRELASHIPLGKEVYLLPLAICVERNSYAAYVLHKLGLVEKLRCNVWG